MIPNPAVKWDCVASAQPLTFTFMVCFEVGG